MKITTWGESHGKAVGAVISEIPANIPLTADEIQEEVDKRRPGKSDFTSPRQEDDTIEILSGVFENKTLGTPICVIVKNKDAHSKDYSSLQFTPRPGHADYTYYKKYGHVDFRGGGRSSGRETLGRVIAGAIAKKIISPMSVTGHVIQIGSVKIDKELDFQTISKANKSEIFCADPTVEEHMKQEIKQCQEQGDSVGGIVEIVVNNVPAGLGEPVFEKLDAELAKALMGIGSVKAVEIGAGTTVASMKGSQCNDPFTIEHNDIITTTNNAGGILGGISSGMPLRLRIYVKPTPSISTQQKTVDMSSMTDTTISITGRHDPCICIRIVPVAQAMVAIVLAQMLMRHKAVRCLHV